MPAPPTGEPTASPGGAGAANNTPDYTHYQLGSTYRKANRAADAAREFKLHQAIKDKKRNGSATPATGQADPAP